ncbi:TetR/AcrR family transcriptional regulator [Demequina capsici]|uniref:TetR/AcrR family transcriptional regulator n=1 Tax=Demequina capsici TaxID=3075620 RepID=A0AA96FDT6_9MICO|nr:MULTISPECIES: TetR/AcrR family transcriptional regulator [unclassified Demequina]WNM25427.1 TetR/AcrR family transcriptional regulator [Demequina sp. OYTSA14]WNM28308.1 TetR/AcrR family transcriptional regulator [Demequina sp. PMTSA13]
MSGDAKAGRPGRTREMILAAAMEMFAESGFHGTSLRDIAGRSGLTHPGVLYHFPTKEALLMAVLERRDEVTGEDYPTEGTTAREVLRSLVGTARLNAGRRGLVELFATLSAEATSADHPAHEFFTQRYESLRDQVAGAFTALAEDGALRPGVEPALAAIQVIAMMDGLQVQWLLDDRIDMGRALAVHLDQQVVTPLEA